MHPYSHFIYKYNTNGPKVIEWMGPTNVVAELNGDGVHHLENAMTMKSDLHDVFDSLSLSFEATVWYCLTSLVQIRLT